MRNDIIGPTLAEFQEARDRVSGVSEVTPMESSRYLAEVLGSPVFLKCENLQRTGSYKIRGAYNRISRLSDEEKSRGVVAAVDATGIGLGAWILGLVFGGFPLVIPIAIAVFLGSFIPVVGALLTGTIAVFVALVYLGPLPAVLMLGIVLLVQQVEGHILQPLVMGSAVKVHPLAVVFAVAAGSFLAGIPGALFAVPVIATLNVMVKYIAGGDWKANPRPTAEERRPNA